MEAHGNLFVSAVLIILIGLTRPGAGFVLEERRPFPASSSSLFSRGGMTRNSGAAPPKIRNRNHDISVLPEEDRQVAFDQSTVTAAGTDDVFVRDAELNLLKQGYSDLVRGQGELTNWQRVATVPDIIMLVGLFPLIGTSLLTAFTGKIVSAPLFMGCAVVTVVTGAAHYAMYEATERDWRAPRLGEARTTYQFSGLYLVAFGWLLARINPLFPAVLEAMDNPMAAALTTVVIYGFAYPFVAKQFLEEPVSTENNVRSGNESRRLTVPGWNPKLKSPSSIEFLYETQLLLTGQTVINALAALFIPFTWVLVSKGTVWWDRVQSLHPHQGAFLGLSVLTAILGDDIGTLLLRLRDTNIVPSWPVIVVLGLVLNGLLLLFPELVFNTVYHAGVSEVGFYWD